MVNVIRYVVPETVANVVLTAVDEQAEKVTVTLLLPYEAQSPNVQPVALPVNVPLVTSSLPVATDVLSMDNLALGAAVPIPTLAVLVSTYSWFVFTAKSPVVERLMFTLLPAAGVIPKAPEAVMIEGVLIWVVKAGLSAKTRAPETPVSSEMTPLSSAEVVAAKTESLLAV